MSTLLLVESPSKVKKIQGFLGSGFKVAATVGHLTELAKGNDAIDVAGDFQCKEAPMATKAKTIRDLKVLVRGADRVLLAMDPDREGEGIAWHACGVLGLDRGTTMRVTFNEITKGAVTGALRSPRPIDRALVDAHLARRAMDRLLGFGVSPFLWGTIGRGLSAGRVQTPALRMVTERDREVDAEGMRMRIEGRAEIAGAEYTLVPESVEGDWGRLGEEMRVLTRNTDWIVVGCESREATKKAPAPFQTSTALRAGAAMGIAAKRMTGVLQAL